jgi:O-glycosyl hydrolase
MRWIPIIACLLTLHSSCGNEKEPETPSGSPVTLTLDLSARQQEIHSFGASDAWSIQFVGREWPLEKRERIAELLFSTEIEEDNSPRGIGLSGWRFNIGAGSAEQGSSSGISDEWRRAECFLNRDGTYNWDKQAGQRWFLKAAREYGIKEITAFVNSPPVHYTKNNRAWADGGSSTNLRDDRFDDYALFLATVTGELQQRDGIGIKYISPVNEPQWDWDNSGQEGTPYTNAEIAECVRAISDQLLNRGLATQIEITDAAKITYLRSYDDKPARGNQAFEFFSPESENYVGDLPNVAHKIAGHSYFTTYPISGLIQERTSLSDAMAELDPGLEFCQSEYCLLESNEEIRGNGRDLGMAPALYMARLIHFDLTIARSSTWYWWLAVSPYDYKDGLVYIDWNEEDGNIYESKLLWTMGNFSRFIRPGMFSHSVIRSDNQGDEQSATSLMVSGYASPDQSQAIFVLVNYSWSDYPVLVRTSDNQKASALSIYTTSSELDENLKHAKVQDPEGMIEIPPKAVVTIVMDL